MKIKSIHNSFVFKFVDRVNSKGEFERGTTKSGFILQSSADDSAKLPRWVDIINAGPSCEFIKTGDRVLLPALRWTAAGTFDGGKLWKSDETQVVAIAGVDQTVQPLGSYLIFKQIKADVQKSKSGLFVVSNYSDNTPKGVVELIGPDVVSELSQSTIYYNDANFFDTFKIDTRTLAFIKEENVIAYEPADIVSKKE